MFAQQLYNRAIDLGIPEVVRLANHRLSERREPSVPHLLGGWLPGQFLSGAMARA